MPSRNENYTQVTLKEPCGSRLTNSAFLSKYPKLTTNENVLRHHVQMNSWEKMLLLLLLIRYARFGCVKAVQIIHAVDRYLKHPSFILVRTRLEITISKQLYVRHLQSPHVVQWRINNRTKWTTTMV